MDPSSPDRWAKIERLLDQALDLKPEHRFAFLERTCSTDPTLRAEVERLLRGTEAADSFLGEPAAAYAAPLVAWVAGRQELAPGTPFGAYEVVRKLGRGGMATVYLAQDHKHHRAVAIKVLHPELASAVGPERFLREIEIAATLHHPHILQLYDSGAAEGLLYYVMPYVQGESLRQRLEREEPLLIETAIGIAREVARALDYAHRQGVVHRDIKPENILLQDGQAIVADFGIARAIGAARGDRLADADSLGIPERLGAVGEPRLTEPGPGIGTPVYMSPEQASSDGVIDGRADIYALGCVLYEMVAGRPPFTGDSVEQIRSRHAVDPVPLLPTGREMVPPAVEQAIRCALAKLPADRFATAQVFAEALAGGNVPITVRPTPGRRTFWRRRAVAVLGGVATIGLALALAARFNRPKPVRVDPAVVAIAPFRVTAADSSLGYLREGMVDLLATKLSGTMTLRPADPRTILNAWRHTSARGDLPESTALSLVARLGAGRLISGEIVGSGSRFTISAVLLQVPEGRVQARAAVEGSSDGLTPLVDQLAAKLLALGAGEPEQRLSSLTGTPLPALRAYLDGQVLLRRMAFEAALRKFEQALAADSTFALAALGIVRARFETDGDLQNPSVQAAWRLRDRLSPRDRAFLEVLLGPRYPRPESGPDRLSRAERFTQLAPDSPDAWYLYGAFLSGAGLQLGIADAQERAKSAFARALALDSSNTASLMSFTSLAAAVRDTAGMQRGMRLVRLVDSTSPFSVALQWEVATVLGDTATARRAALNDSMVSMRADGYVQTGPWPLMTVFLHEGLGNRDLDLVLERSLAMAPTEAQRTNLQNLQYRLELIRGRPSRARPPPSWDASWKSVQIVLDAIFADGDSAAAVPAAAALRRVVGWPLARYAAGQYALESNQLQLARRAQTDLQGFHGNGADSVDAVEQARGFALILQAQIAARQRSPMAAEWLRQLDSVLANTVGEDVPLFGNLVAAHLHADRGELAAALAAVRRRQRGGELWPAYVNYHIEEGRLAELTGDTAGAIRAYRRYLGIRGDAEPHLQPQVQRARAALAAVERAFKQR